MAYDQRTAVLEDEVRRLRQERDEARNNARILAHAYEHDVRPLARAVRDSLAYPVDPRKGKKA